MNTSTTTHALRRRAWAVAGAVLMLVAAGGAPARAGSIVEVAAEAGQFETLLRAAQAAGLADTLATNGPQGAGYTLFAPTDEAFNRLGQDTLERLLSPGGRDQLRAILAYHVVAGAQRAKQVTAASALATLNGQRVSVATDQGTVRINRARVLQADVGADNGVIHVIDRVLMPELAPVAEVAQGRGRLSTFVTALGAAGLADTLSGDGPFTVLAPTDAAFERLPEGTVEGLLRPENRAALAALLKRHVVAGRAYSDQLAQRRAVSVVTGERLSLTATAAALEVADARVVQADVQASNGVIHLIDRVLVEDAVDVAVGASGLRMKSAGLLESAIAKGVPLFNNGQTRACFAVYAVTAEALLGLQSGLTQPERRMLAAALREADRSAHARDAAWVLRRAFDALYPKLTADDTHGNSEPMTGLRAY